MVIWYVKFYCMRKFEMSNNFGSYRFNVRRPDSLRSDLNQEVSKEVISCHKAIDELILNEIIKKGNSSVEVFLYKDVALSERFGSTDKNVYIDGYSPYNFLSIVDIVVEELENVGWVIGYKKLATFTSGDKGGVKLTINKPNVDQ